MALYTYDGRPTKNVPIPLRDLLNRIMYERQDDYLKKYTHAIPLHSHVRSIILLCAKNDVVGYAVHLKYDPQITFRFLEGMDEVRFEPHGQARSYGYLKEREYTPKITKAVRYESRAEGSECPSGWLLTDITQRA